MLQKVEAICEDWGPETYVLGVHKRLACSEMVACQLSQRSPSCLEYLSKAQELLRKTKKRRRVVFLATDDLEAAREFMASGIQLVCREVKRSSGGQRADGTDNEVHRGLCEELDAEDALVDALCLARCEELICVDSNLSIFAMLWNPELRLHAFTQLLPESWEEEAESPVEVVYESYEVVFEPMVFVRQGPSTATQLLGASWRGILEPKRLGSIFKAAFLEFKGRKTRPRSVERWCIAAAEPSRAGWRFKEAAGCWWTARGEESSRLAGGLSMT